MQQILVEYVILSNRWRSSKPIGKQAEKFSDTRILSCPWRAGGRASRASRLHRDNRPAISGLHPTADKKHGHGQRSGEARTH